MVLNRLTKGICFGLLAIGYAQWLSAQPTKYSANDGFISGVNTGYYNNRPLYINNTNAFVLTGDQPIARLAKREYLYGTFMLAVERKGTVKWLQHCDRIVSLYNTGRMAWKITDQALPGMTVNLQILPVAKATGMAVKAEVEGVETGDRLLWIFGGAQWRKKENLSWKLDVMGQPELLTWGFSAGEARHNQVHIKEGVGYVNFVDSIENRNLFTATCRSSPHAELKINDATFWNTPLQFLKSQSGENPILSGQELLQEGKATYWVIEAFDGEINTRLSDGKSVDEKYSEGLQRVVSFQNRLKINTPDPYLNAVASASVAAVDGTWYPPVFVHGGMQWNVRYPGWRTIYGGTMYGWHDRVRAEAKYYTNSQVRTNDKRFPEADTTNQLTIQGPNSRFYGLGRIIQDQSVYNMQTQFFDQIIEEYRWTNDPELLNFFREALELHLRWQSDCFDSDGDGVYESYINVWPTDSQWYNGGGTAEETSYAYRGHLAARDMARNAGDLVSVNYHEEVLEKIRTNFFKKLWIKEKGHSASYVESGRHKRLHQNPWLYSIFLPVEAGLTTELQSIESVYYSEWALQNDQMSSGGRKVWTSNWVPGTWSVRELWPGDNYALSLAYFKAGLPDEAWDILRGSFMHSAYNDIVPGNLGARQGGIDFGDCVPTFARALVTGLFGYQPDYPNGYVKVAPGFPSSWNYASIEVPDVKINFRQDKKLHRYTINLAKAANLDLYLPVRCKYIKRVMVDNKLVPWNLLPAVGRSVVNIKMPSTSVVEVLIETDNEELPYFAPEHLVGNIGDRLQLNLRYVDQIIDLDDPQGVLESVRIKRNTLTGKLTANKGYHTLSLRVRTGKSLQWRIYRVKIDDPIGDSLEAGRFVKYVPPKPRWINVDIAGQFNADVTTIYQQKYLTPRPATVSAQLGTDGYSPWTFKFWNSYPPVIKLDNVGSLKDREYRIMTNQKIPFLWTNSHNNVAFTSLWDNYPAKIDFLVRQSGDAIYFLVCGSTNVMQCQIANAVIRLHYADGKTDSLELVPPVNYWNLSTITANATAPGQESRNDYTADVDKFCLPAILPQTVQLGENCRAMLLNLRMRKGIELTGVSLETLSQEVVVGLMGITIMKEE